MFVGGFIIDGRFGKDARSSELGTCVLPTIRSWRETEDPGVRQTYLRKDLN